MNNEDIIKLQFGDDGVWIHFRAPGGRHAMLNLNHVVDEHAPHSMITSIMKEELLSVQLDA